MDELLKRIKKQTDLMSSPVTEEDKETLSQNAPRNALIDALGLPESLKQTVADEKEFAQNFGQLAAEGTFVALPAMKKVADIAVDSPKFDKILELLKRKPAGKILREAEGASHSPAQRPLTAEEKALFEELTGPKKYKEIPPDEVARYRQERAEIEDMLPLSIGVEKEMARLAKEQAVAKEIAKKSGSHKEITDVGIPKKKAK